MVYASDLEVYQINTVVHVLYADEIQNISDEQIKEQINALNLDFGKRNLDVVDIDEEFTSVSSDARIQFSLASLDQNGEATNGITRHQTNHGAYANADVFSTELGGADPWDTDQYLNIWVADLAPTLVGYTYSPNGEDELSQGVVVDFEAFGLSGTAEAPYHLGRTLTHEVGHYLGLQHLWGTGGCDSDDGVSDTPNQERRASCEVSSSSCGTPDMTQNFMNLADDQCLLFFTEGQGERMRSSLEQERPNIWSKVDAPVLATDDPISLEAFTIYPNPVRKGEKLNIHLKNKTISPVSIYNMQGVMVSKFQPSNTTNQIELPALGTYFLSYTDRDNRFIEKIICTKR